MTNLPSDPWWTVGSAFIYIMLLAGAGASSYSAHSGAFVFNMDYSPSAAYWAGLRFRLFSSSISIVYYIYD